MVQQKDAAPTYLKEHSQSPHAPPGPWHGTWSIRYLDKIKSAKLMLSQGASQAYEDFPDVLRPGTAFPAMRLETTDGRSVNTADFKGQKHFVVMTGAIT